MRSIGKAKKGMLLVLTVLLVCMLSAVGVGAVTLPDLEAEGSISVTMTDPNTGKTVSGGSLLLFKVGEVYVEDADYSWVLSESFAKSELDLSDLEDEDLMSGLTKYIVSNGINYTAKAEVDANGKATFEDLGVGLYLVGQIEAATGYQAIMPFLVTIPTKSEDEWVYDVDATPKMEILLTGTPTPTVTPTITPRATITPRKTITPRSTITPRVTVTTPPKTTLPKTGQLWWPVPILAAVGIVFVFVGFRRRSR